jgi:hypothetical protein
MLKLCILYKNVKIYNFKVTVIQLTNLNISPASTKLSIHDLPLSPPLGMFSSTTTTENQLIKRNNESIFSLTRDIYNGVSGKTNNTKAICKYKHGQRFTHVEAALKRDVVVSVAGEITSYQNKLIFLCECIEWLNKKTNKDNDIKKNNNNKQKERFKDIELMVNEFENTSNNNKRSNENMNEKGTLI